MRLVKWVSVVVSSSQPRACGWEIRRALAGDRGQPLRPASIAKVCDVIWALSSEAR
jgi:hypothetical protein